MDRYLAKYSHKYEFLKLELEERQDQLEGYLGKWNKHVGKHFVSKGQTVWIDEETGDMRTDDPTVEKEKKTEADPRLRKVYKKISKKAHPDKGGTKEDFNELKIAYEDRDILALIKLSVKYNIPVLLVKEDTDLIEKSISDLTNKLSEITQSLVWNYFNGNENERKSIILELEQVHGIKLTEKEIDDFLSA
jgi:ribosome-binding protein aMBF1 (putative translation factor)